MLEENWMVLGAGGFIGAAMVETLKERHCRFAAVYRNASAISGTSCQISDVNEGNNLRQLLQEKQPTLLLNALGHPVEMGESAMPEFYQLTTTIVLDAVRSVVPACRVILLGSAAEYGNSPVSGSCEGDALRPLTTYGQAKAGQFEIACRYGAKGIKSITARLFNPVGPRQGTRQFAGALMMRIHNGEHPLQANNANHLRDWIDIRDVASALITLATAPKPPVVANVCTGSALTVGAVAAKVATIAGVEIQPVSGSITPTTLWRSVGNPELLHGLGWRPRYTLEQSLADQWRCMA